VLSTNQKGAIAEASIAREAIKLGIGVYKPLTDLRADFIFEVGTKLLRIQCNWAVQKGDVLSVYCYSARRSRTGIVKRIYTADEIDAFAAYCPELDSCYFTAASISLPLFGLVLPPEFRFRFGVAPPLRSEPEASGEAAARTGVIFHRR